MIQIPKNQGKSPEFNKKAIRMIVILFILGILTGMILSFVFINEANQRIQDIENRDRPYFKNGDFNAEPLSLSDIILPSIGVIIVRFGAGSFINISCVSFTQNKSLVLNSQTLRVRL